MACKQTFRDIVKERNKLCFTINRPLQLGTFISPFSDDVSEVEKWSNNLLLPAQASVPRQKFEISLLYDGIFIENV